MLTSVESSKASFQVQHVATDWMISDEELVIFQDPNGADCILGEGKFGSPLPIPLFYLPT